MKILFTGGGTAGHIFPIIAIIRELRKIWRINFEKEKLEFYYIGPKDPFASIFLSHEGVIIKEVMAGKLRRYFDWKAVLQNIFDLLFKIPIGICQAFFYIFVISPDIIFSKGGYGSLPATIAGWLLWIPIFLHESDVTPGMVNRFLSKICSQIFVSFPDTEYFSLKKIIITGNPIRKEILVGSKEEAKKIFKLTSQKPVILIIGGSQGAQRINDIILTILPELLQEFEIIHQCGENNFKELQAETDVVIKPEFKKYYHLFPFLKEIELSHAYQVADLIISRAGSGSIFEIAAVGKPSILIPLPESAQNHQVKNALSYSQTGAAIIIEEKNLTHHLFLEKLRYLFNHQEELEKMSKAAKEFSQIEAAKIIAENLINFFRKKI